MGRNSLDCFVCEWRFLEYKACNSVMCGYFRIGFIDLMLKGKSLLGYTNLFSPNEY